MGFLKKLTSSLAWSGTVPFIIALILSIKERSLFGFFGEQIFIFYSILICCFMAGSLWGQAIYSTSAQTDTKKVKKTVVFSNLIVLAIFAGLLAQLADRQMLILLAGCYLVTLLTELTSLDSATRRRLKSYLSMRSMVTLAVFIMHCFLFASLKSPGSI